MKLNKPVMIIVLVIGVIITSFLFPWWAPAIWILVATALFRLKLKPALLSGGVSLGGLWLLMALFHLSKDNTGIISKTGELMGGMSSVMMILMTTFIGSVTGLLAAWLGSRISSYSISKS